jgi:hypothetical protein
MKFTIDFTIGFAHPAMQIVQRSPKGIRGWFFQPVARRIMAPDGYVYLAALRLLGVTIGVTVTRECATPITGQASPAEQQLPPEILAQIEAMRTAHAAQKSGAAN